MARVLTIAPALRQPNVYEFVAPDPIAAGQRTARLVVTLSLPDKLAVGNRLTLDVLTSANGGATWDQRARIDWTSYGPDGLTVTHPDGTTTENPDPTINFPMGRYAGQRVKVRGELFHVMTAGATIDIVA